MSSFQSQSALTISESFGFDDKPILLGETQGASFLPSAVQTMVDRSIYASTEGGAGQWLFGSLNTPSRWMLNTVMGWDDNAHLKPDSKWEIQDGEKMWGSVPPEMVASVMYLGGQELADDIMHKSVSLAHFQQRLHEAEVIGQAKYSIEQYDKESFLMYPGMKVTSALINYVGSDPSTAITLVATGGLGTAAAAARGATTASRVTTAFGALGRAGGVGTYINTIASTHTKSWRAATYLWNASDGASAGYSSWDQLKRDNERLYGGEGSMATSSWTTSTLFGAGLGLAFTGAFDMMGRMLKPRAPGATGPSTLEHYAVTSSEGHRGTPADFESLNIWRTSKSRLETAIDSTEGATSDTRRLLMDSDEMDRLGWGDAKSMDDLSDFILREKPNTKELNDFVHSRIAARDANLAEAVKWNTDVNLHVQGGGDPRHFWRSKAHALLRSHAGADYAKYRFIIDFLEEATGDAEQVARWMVHADGNRVGRAVNAINAAKRIGAVEERALSAAAEKVRVLGRIAADDKAEQAANRMIDNFKQGRWSAAHTLARELQDEVAAKSTTILTDVRAQLATLNTEWTAMNRAARKQNGAHRDLINALTEYNNLLTHSADDTAKVTRAVAAALSPKADVAAAKALSELGLTGPRAPGSTAHQNATAKIVEAIKKYRDARTRIDTSLTSTQRLQKGIKDAAGDASLDKTMTEVGTFPHWKADLSDAAMDGIHNTAVGQTRASSLWKASFVDDMVGEGASDAAMRTGSFPTAPVLHETPTLKALSAEEQGDVLAHEMRRVDPEIKAIKEAAKDAPIEDRLAAAQSNRQTVVDSLKRNVDMLAARPRKTDKIGTKLAEMIEAKTKLVSRFDNNIKRIESKIAKGEDIFNAPLQTPVVHSPRSVREAEMAAQVKTHTAASDKLAKMANEAPEKLTTGAGLKLRNAVRDAGAAFGAQTRYGGLRNLVGMLNEEMTSAAVRIKTLLDAGSTEADTMLIAARKEMTYLEKQLTKANQHIADIDLRPAQMQRNHALNSSTPHIAHVAGLTRFRVAIQRAMENGQTAVAERLNREMYQQFGDTSRLPRWAGLEDLMVKMSRDADGGVPGEIITNVKMQGRNIEVTIEARPQGDIVNRLDIEDEVSSYKGDPTIHPSEKTKSDGPHLAREEQQAARTQEQQLVDAVVKHPENIAGREANDTVRVARTEIFTPAEAAAPVVAVPGSRAPGSTTPVGAATEAAEEAAAKQAALLGVLRTEGDPGDNLLITSALLRTAARIPGMEGFGRFALRFATAGTGFGQMHNHSNAVSIVISAFNMLDRPEALVRSLGRNVQNLRTMQNFRDQSQNAIAEVIGAYNVARRGGEWTPGSNQLVNQALNTGVTAGLNAGERAVYTAMRRHYDVVGRGIEAMRPGSVLPNYHAREAHKGLINHLEEAGADFRSTYLDHLMSGATPMPPSVMAHLSALGVPPSTTWAALTPAQQAIIRPALEEFATESANQSIKRLTHQITEDGVGYARRAGIGSSNSGQRVMDDAVRNDPRIARWFIQDPVANFKQYMQVRAPATMFNAQLSRVVGVSTSFDELIAALEVHAATMPLHVSGEFNSSLKILRDKWEYASGRAQYNPSLAKDGMFRTGTGLLRGSVGSFWGLAGLTTEVPRAIMAAKMYGGGMSGLVDAVRYILRSGDPHMMDDIGHSVDQMSGYAHSTHGQAVGSTVVERFTAPWERVYNVATGREAMMQTGEAYGRVAGTVIATAEALGETAMRAGGMHYFSGMARVIADRQAKRYISRNIDALVRLSDRIHALGPVSEATPQAIAAFKAACAAEDIAYDVAIQMNHTGLLAQGVTANIRNGLAGTDAVFNLNQIRAGMDDTAFSSVSDFLSAAHNYAVPTGSLATSVIARSAIERYFYMLSSYSRSFASGVAFRTAANGSFQAQATAFAAVAIGENIYQTLRSVAKGDSTIEDIQTEWSDNPTKYFLKNAIKSPYLGTHNSLAAGVLDAATGGNLGTHSRGGNIFSAVTDTVIGAGKLVYGEEPISEQTYSIVKAHTPILNSWYTRLAWNAVEQ